MADAEKSENTKRQLRSIPCEKFIELKNQIRQSPASSSKQTQPTNKSDLINILRREL